MNVERPHFVAKTPAFGILFYYNYLTMKEEILDGKLSKLNLFNKNFIKDIIQKQSSLDTCYFDQLLWKIWNIARWYERYAN